MKKSVFIIIEPSDEKWKAFTSEIQEEHKELIRTRIKNRDEEVLLDWNDVKNDFEGI